AINATRTRRPFERSLKCLAAREAPQSGQTRGALERAGALSVTPSWRQKHNADCAEGAGGRGDSEQNGARQSSVWELIDAAKEECVGEDHGGEHKGVADVVVVLTGVEGGLRIALKRFGFSPLGEYVVGHRERCWRRCDAAFGFGRKPRLEGRREFGAKPLTIE